MNAERPWAWPLVPLYVAVQQIQSALRPSGRQLRWPVLSVGSLSAGGAGKTPVVIALAKLLTETGWVVHVLSRGYGRSGSGVACVVPDAEDAAARFGDEPVLIAREAHVPVWVGARRWEAGFQAELTPNPTHAPRLHLLDDGFQHRQLARTLDVVLVTAADLDDAPLPAGNRREPLVALRRAHVVVVRAEERESVVPRVRPHMRRDAGIWIIRRSIQFPPPLGVLSAGLRPLAFCALARPHDFAASVKAAGCGLLDTMAFPDHHRYQMSDMDLLVQTGTQMRASGLVTTAKDAVKLSAAMRERLASIGPVVVPALTVDFGDREGVLQDLRERLR